MAIGQAAVTFKGTYTVSGYTPTGHQIKHEVWISGLKGQLPDEQTLKFSTFTPFVVGPGSVSTTILINSSELIDLAAGAKNYLHLEYHVAQVDAQGAAVVGGAQKSAVVSFIIQVTDYGDIIPSITSPANGQVFNITI